MVRSVASQIPRVTSAAAGSAVRHGSRPLSAWSKVEQARPLNRRLEVDLQELTLLQSLDRVTLIDVRQPTELLSQDQIPDSLHIPLGNLRGAFQLSPEEWQQKFGTPKPAKASLGIIFYARGPIASSAAVEIAHKLGYRKSRHYVGGWEDYCAQNKRSITKARSDATSTAPAVTQDDPLQQHYNYHYYNPDLHYM